jgi:uncharacterized protein
MLGNHDKGCGAVPTEWRMEVVHDDRIDGPFVWRHWPTEHDAGYVLAGHLHPVAALRGKGRQKLRLRCFALGRRRMILPAFGGFTGGAVGAPDAADKVFVVAGDEVIEVPRT